MDYFTNFIPIRIQAKDVNNLSGFAGNYLLMRQNSEKGDYLQYGNDEIQRLAKPKRLPRAEIIHIIPKEMNQ